MRIGIVGLGFMGGMHLNAWQKVEGARVVAVCTRGKVTGKAKQGNIAGESDELDLAGVTSYTDLSEMLAKEALDAVSITLPTHLHRDVAIQCLEAGVHVLCEKPMALNTTDCDLMIDAADAAGKKLMVAHCIRFWPEYVWLKNTVDEKTYGEVRVADFERLTHMPAWSEKSWLADPSKSGGIALDLLIHDLDFINYLFGPPRTTRSRHVRLDSGVTAHTRTVQEYGRDLVVTATASWLMPEAFGFKMAFQVIFENGVAVFDGQHLKVYTSEGESLEPELPPGDGYLAEISYFSECILNSHELARNPPAQSAESVRIALEAAK